MSKTRGMHAAQEPRFKLVSAKDLDSGDYTPRPIIADCFYANHPSVVGGMFKTCKTLIALDGAISIASGCQFLNTFPVPEPMAVVYFSGEGGPSMTQEYGRRIADSKGLRLSDVGNLYLCFRVPKFESLADLDEVQRIHDETAAEVMFFDNLMLCINGDEPGNVFRMGQVLGNLVRICSERGITPILVHHFKRTRATDDKYAPGELLDLTQAGAAEVAEQWWLLTRREDYSPDAPGEHKLWLNVGGRLGHGALHALDVNEGRLSDTGGRRWQVDVLPSQDARKAAKETQQTAKAASSASKSAEQLEADRREIVAIAAKLGTADTKNGLRDRVGCSHRRFARAFTTLVSDGTLQPAKVKNPNNKQEYDGWNLRNDKAA